MMNAEMGLVHKHIHREPEKVTIGDGNNVNIEYESDMIGTLLDVNGNKKQVMIKNVMYVPSLFVKIYRITTEIKNGMRLGNKGLEITLENDNIKLIFDTIIETKKGYLASVNITPQIQSSQENMAMIVKKTEMDSNLMHESLGHSHITTVI